MPWPLARVPLTLYADVGYHNVCFPVPSDVVAGLPDEINGEYLWTLPPDLRVRAPAAVAASATWVLPDVTRATGTRPSRDPDHSRLPSSHRHRMTGRARGHKVFARPPGRSRVEGRRHHGPYCPARRARGSWDWNRWSWFEYRFAAAEVDGRRVIDIQATCTVYAEDEEPSCTSTPTSARRRVRSSSSPPHGLGRGGGFEPPPSCSQTDSAVLLFGVGTC